jgi:hypothetical protein
MPGMILQAQQRSVSAPHQVSTRSLEQWRRDLSDPSVLYRFGANAMIDLPQPAPPWTLQIVHHESTSSGTSNDGLAQLEPRPSIQPDDMLYPSSDYLSLRQVQHERWTAAHARAEMNGTSENVVLSRVENQGDIGWDSDTLGKQELDRTVASLNSDGTFKRAASADADATAPMQLARSDALRNAEWERAQPQGVGPSRRIAKDNDDVAYPLLYSSSDKDSGTDSKKLARRERRRKQKRHKAKRKKKRSRGDSGDDQDDSRSTSHALDKRGDDDDTVSADSEIARRRRRRRRREKRRQKRKRYHKYPDNTSSDRPRPFEDDDATVDSIPFAQDRKRLSRRTSPMQSMTTDSVDWSSDSSSHSTKGGDDSDNGGSNRLHDKRKRRRNDPRAAAAERDDQRTASNDDRSAKRSGQKRSST